MKIAVVGAGVVGLSTAYNILQDVTGADVTVIADKLGNETTSSGAGGHFRPNIGHIKGIPVEKLKEWSRTSRDHYFKLASSPESKESGNMFMSGYLLLDKPEEGVLEDIVLHFRQLSTKEMESLNFKQRAGMAVCFSCDRFYSQVFEGHSARKALLKGIRTVPASHAIFLLRPSYTNGCAKRHLKSPKMSPEKFEDFAFGKHRYGYVYTTVVTEMKKYLMWLSSRIVQKGGSIVKRRLSSLDELIGQYEVIVNCGGLGSRELIGDTSIHPVKGQLVKVKAPWINMFYTSESNGISTYVYPHSDIVNIGGSREVGALCPEPDLNVAEDIIKRTKRLVPALEGAKIVENWVGFRPTRTPLRLEYELLKVKGKHQKVVHNYGHGAQGITLSWGTAVEAARLVKNLVQSQSARSKL